MGAFIPPFVNVRGSVFEPLQLLNFLLDADPDPVFHSNADPDPQPWAKIIFPSCLLSVFPSTIYSHQNRQEPTYLLHRKRKSSLEEGAICVLFLQP